MKKMLLTAVVVGLAGSAAMAGSPEPYVEYVHMPPPEPETRWDGVYVGLLGGVLTGEVAELQTEFDATTYGGFAGFNFQDGDMVYGVEVALQTGRLSIPETVDLDILFDAKARVGYSFGDALVFGSGGYSNLDADECCYQASGWNLGAGIDYALTEKFFVGGEYVYRSFNNPADVGEEATSHAGQLRLGLKF